MTHSGSGTSAELRWIPGTARFGAILAWLKRAGDAVRVDVERGWSRAPTVITRSPHDPPRPETENQTERRRESFIQTALEGVRSTLDCTRAWPDSRL